MLPFISTPLGKIPTFTVLSVLGTLAMLFSVHALLKRDGRIVEEPFIYPRLVVCMVTGFVSAVVADTVFKYIEYGVLKVYGITFYGSLIGASTTLFVLLKITKKETVYSISQWFNLLTRPFIIFHIFGRLGCFLGGCCYGKHSESVFAVAFPDNEAMGILHNGQKCFPTQLYEAILLAVILLIVNKTRNKFITYLLLYAVARFFLEFLRGDDRGMGIPLLSPSQLISLIVAVAVVVYKIHTRQKAKRCLKTAI